MFGRIIKITFGLRLSTTKKNEKAQKQYKRLWLFPSFKDFTP